MLTGWNFLSLRQNFKRKSMEVLGSVKVYKKYTDWNYKSSKYRKHREKEIAIEANMIHLLTIVKSYNLEPHLSFRQKNLKSDSPFLDIKRSYLLNGGLGVFVTDNCVSLANNQPQQINEVPS